MVYRVYVEKKKGLTHEADELFSEAKELLRIESLTAVRILNRYDAENISPELFEHCKTTVFSEPQLDILSDNINARGGLVFAVEYLPGQFDQRADSAAQCIQLISQSDRPLIRTAKIYILYGDLTREDVQKIKKYVINPVESREAVLDTFDTLKAEYTVPTEVATLTGFLKLTEKQLAEFAQKYALAMDADDLAFCQKYFQSEKRDPTITEIRMIDTYWSDHCRHTTFLTEIDHAQFEDALLEQAFARYMQVRKELGRTKPVTLMDIATIAAKYLKKTGKLDKLDESEEINACTVKMEIEVDGKKEPWLLLFKNETHNHPTEIEPFGGAATCIGGAIRDPLSGRAYVYAAMRVTGAGDPLTPVEDTIPGKLPQRKIVTTAANGYSSYGNQIGLATGIVDEIYHPGYTAKRLEIGAVIAATPAENVRREEPQPGDIVILLGGRTGRDGCGGATGSSKSHTLQSLEACGAEVQKGNAPEERKLQRLLRNKDASLLIKRCNDFGAGGVSVAIGELADGLDIDLNAVPKKYEGLDGTELAISESQERMAVVVAPEDAQTFQRLAQQENLEATVVARVKAEKRLTMTWNGKAIVDLSREFLNSNGAPKHIDITPEKPQKFEKEIGNDFTDEYFKTVSDLNICSKKGLSERFDSTIGAGTVLMPFGGKYQQTPIQAMVNKISCEQKHTDDVSFMAWGYNPFIAEKSPYHGAYLAVVESVCKLIATGADFSDVYLTFQEYFERPGKDGKRWGQPLAALLGAFQAQLDLGIGAIGGKDSMSGSFEKMDVPPTLVSFAVTTGKVSDVVSPEFKAPHNKLVLLEPEYDENGLPVPASLLALFRKVTDAIRSKKAVAVYTPGEGGLAEAVFKMAIGNGVGAHFDSSLTVKDIFRYRYGSFLIELADDIEGGVYIGETTDDGCVSYRSEELTLDNLLEPYENKLNDIYHYFIDQKKSNSVRAFTYTAQNRPSPAIKVAKPKVLIPVFPGTNCEYDTAKAFLDAGAQPDVFVINNMTPAGVAESVQAFAQKLKDAQIVFIPGGFSGGDEPDGSGKFITAFFRNAAVTEGVTELLEKRDGLMGGICNGFQALIKLGLVPYGRITDTKEDDPTLTFNTIGRHQSKIVRVRIASNLSPWFSATKPDEIYSVPISHGEGRFLAPDSVIRTLAENGQIATQYVDLTGNVSADIRYNPNNSAYAVEGITSPDGRVFGKMGHTERWNAGLYQNVPGEYDMKLFASAIRYFK